MAYLEPIYLNEEMLLNCAAYLFKGVTLETEHSESTAKSTKGNLSLGFKLLTDLIAPMSASVEGGISKDTSTKSARRYTLGGLHMTLLNALEDENILCKKDVINDEAQSGNYVQIDAILKPIDLFSIIEALKIAAPLASQFISSFGNRINKDVFNQTVIKEIPKYEELIANVLEKLESDYLKSGQIEMIMVDPISGSQIGIVDIDVPEGEASKIKAKLTDGRFQVIGKVSRTFSKNESMSLVQRTVLSSIVGILDKLVNLNGIDNAYVSSVEQTRNKVERLCQLSIEGPAIRVIAMSVCV